MVLLRLLGLDPEKIPEGARAEFFWSHAPKSWAVFVLLFFAAGLVYGVFYLYRREIASSPRRIRLLLAFLRAAVLIVLLLVFMGPALAISQQRTIQPYVVMLLDDSLSMSIKDRYREDLDLGRVAGAIKKDPEQLREQPVSRAEVVDALLAGDEGKLLKEIGAKGQLKILTFSNTVKLREARGMPGAGGPRTEEAGQELQLEKGEPIPPLQPSGPGTNIAKGLREALKSLAGQPVAGVVLVSDGQNTEGDDPLNAAEHAARQGVPLFTLGIGDPSEPRNIRVAEVWAPDSVFRDDPFVLQAKIETRGIPGAGLQVELLRRRAEKEADGAEAGDGEVLERKALPGGGSGAQGEPVTVAFEHKPQEAGEFLYTIRVPLQAHEQLDSDNKKSIAIKVLSEQARVLLISGSPTWEYQMVKTLLTRDKTIQLSCWLQSMDVEMVQEGNRKIVKLPRKLKELFEYDVILMFDCNPVEFDEEWIENLKKFLGEHGGGALWMAGPKFSRRFFDGGATQHITEVLPVRLAKLDATQIESLGVTQTREWPLRITPAGVDHVLLRLNKDPQLNRRMGESLPGIFWSYPIEEAKPAAQILAEHSDPQLKRKGKARPLLVAGQYGPGRSVFMGFDGTWRWRKLGERYFDQFWIQTVRFLLEGRLLGSKKRGQLGTDRDVYAIGERVALSAKLYDKDFKPLEEPSVPLVILLGASQIGELPLKAVPNRPGHYEASVIASKLGLNEAYLQLPGEEQGSKVRIAKSFAVEVPRVEFADPRLNKPLLRDLAERTGGRYFDVHEAGGLAKAIPDRRETLVVRGKPIELWDTGQLLALLALLLSVEWAVRKAIKLL